VIGSGITSERPADAIVHDGVGHLGRFALYGAPLRCSPPRDDLRVGGSAVLIMGYVVPLGGPSNVYESVRGLTQHPVRHDLRLGPLEQIRTIRTQLIIAPSIKTEGKVFQRVQKLGWSNGSGWPRSASTLAHPAGARVETPQAAGH
jgi:hypothetical protein